MLFCNHCNVSVRGAKAKCPLCNNLLEGIPNSDEDICPEIPISFQKNLFTRIMIFISIVIIVLSFTTYYLFPININWPILVLYGILSMWLSVIFIIKKSNNIAKTIMWQVTIISLLSTFWDYNTGWRGWSLDFVIPITCVSAMLVMYVLTKVMKVSVRDYIVYFLLNSLLGIIPVVFLLLDWVDIKYPSIVCVAFSVIFLAAIIIFQGENIKIELNKRMHV